MLFKRFFPIPNPSQKSHISTFFYEIPERYRESFYLANAAFFDQVNWYLHRAYEICFPRLVTQLKDKNPKLTDAEAVKRIKTTIELLDQCNSITDIRFPITRDYGKKEIVRGFRAQYGLFSGFETCLGGLRLSHDLTRDHIKALAALSTYKHACMGIRLAGGHGGVRIDPKLYSDKELKQILEIFSSQLHKRGFCDGLTDIIEPDINVGEREVAWIASMFPKSGEKLMVAGKPVEMGGIDNYAKMASQGIFFALDHFLNNEGVLTQIGISKTGLAQKTFIIQGLGKLGSSLAKFLENSGAICVGIKERDAQLYDADGIDIKAALEHKNKYGSFQNFGRAIPATNDDIFKQPCDILVLAAQQKSLICYVADKVKAKIIVEGANGAVTPTSHRIFTSRSKLVLPDIYVSSGHCIASYLEYLLVLKKSGKKFPVLRHLYRNILDAFNSSEETRQVVSLSTTQKMVCCEMVPDVFTYAIDHVMKETGLELLDIAKDYKLNLDLRTAGYIKAIQSIHNSIYELKND